MLWLSKYFHAFWASLVAQTVKNLPAMWEDWVQPLGWEDPLEDSRATHSSILAWGFPWTEEHSRLQSMGSQRIRHSWATKQSTYNFSSWLPSQDTGNHPGIGLPFSTVCMCIWMCAYVQFSLYHIFSYLVIFILLLWWAFFSSSVVTNYAQGWLSSIKSIDS